MDKDTLREIDDIVFDLECEARKNCAEFLQKNDRAKYMYWRGRRAALSDLSTEITLMLKREREQ